jgi:hypothetical protein
MAGITDAAGDFLNSDKGEKVSDAGLDKAGDAADKATGGGHSEQIDKATEAADEKVGD